MLIETFELLYNNHIKVKDLCFIIVQYITSDFGENNIIEIVEDNNIEFYKRVFSGIEYLWFDWWCISWNWILTEHFIREYEDRIDWWPITVYQKLSESFIREFKHRISWEKLQRNKHLSDELKGKLKELFD